MQFVPGLRGVSSGAGYNIVGNNQPAFIVQPFLIQGNRKQVRFCFGIV